MALLLSRGREGETATLCWVWLHVAGCRRVSDFFLDNLLLMDQTPAKKEKEKKGAFCLLPPPNQNNPALSLSPTEEEEGTMRVGERIETAEAVLLMMSPGAPERLVG